MKEFFPEASLQNLETKVQETPLERLPEGEPLSIEALDEPIALEADRSETAENTAADEITDTTDIEADVQYDDNGNAYRIGDELIPNNTYEINGYTYCTGDLGRIVSVEGTVQLKDREERLPIKDSMEVIGKGDQKITDDRGHLIADQLNGSNGMENLIPQDANINRRDYKLFENDLAREVKAGNEVYVKIDVIYSGDSHRPTALVVQHRIKEEENIRIFPNSQEGQS